MPVIGAERSQVSSRVRRSLRMKITSKSDPSSHMAKSKEIKVEVRGLKKTSHLRFKTTQRATETLQPKRELQRPTVISTMVTSPVKENKTA